MIFLRRFAGVLPFLEILAPVLVLVPQPVSPFLHRSSNPAAHTCLSPSFPLAARPPSCARPRDSPRASVRSGAECNRVLRCAAATIAASTTNSVYDDDIDEATATSTSTHNTIVHVKNAPSVDSPSSLPASSSEGETKTVLGDIVLSGWLDELPPLSVRDFEYREEAAATASEKQGHAAMAPASERSNADGRRYTDRQEGNSGSSSSDQGQHDDSAPFRFQQLIQVKRVCVYFELTSLAFHSRTSRLYSCATIETNRRTMRVRFGQGGAN